MILLVLIVYVLLIIYEFMPLYKQKLWRDFWVNMVLAAFSLTVAILLSLDVKVPSPEAPIRETITSVFGK
ncbi:MAG: hypothetical protein N3B21_08170 [Clostridia bacterium]|nr:hypothetical protein [Clostridia bacterium]